MKEFVKGVCLGIVAGLLGIAIIASAQQAVNVSRISAPATNRQNDAGSDSIVCSTGTGCTTNNGDPCGNGNLSHLTFNVASTGTTAVVLVAATSAKNTYICELSIITNNAAGDTVSILDGTQMTNPCDNGTPVGLMGSTTAANGVFLANGIQKGSGAYTVLKTTASNRQVCAIFASSTRATVTGTYVSN